MMTTQQMVYRMLRTHKRATAPQLTHACQVPDSTMRDFLARQVKQGLLDKIDAPDGRSAYILTRKGARIAGPLNSKWTTPGHFTFAQQRKLCAVFEYCFAELATEDGHVLPGVGAREKFLRPQFEKVYPTIAEALPNNTTVVWNTLEKRLETLNAPNGYAKNAVRDAGERFFRRWDAFTYEENGTHRNKKTYPLRDYLKDGELIDVLLVPNGHVEHAILSSIENRRSYHEAAVKAAREQCRRVGQKSKRNSETGSEALRAAHRARSKAETGRDLHTIFEQQLEIVVLPKLHLAF